MKEFKVSEYITLKLEYGKTVIYVNGELFKQCKFLLLNIPIDEVSSFDEIKSIDEASEKIIRLSEHRKGIDSKTEFWGHCSNIQVWVENSYNTCLLHRTIAFPLLKKLTELGEPNANKIFKEEIVKRFLSKHLNTVVYLVRQNYLRFLNQEELDFLFENFDFSSLIEVHIERNFEILKKLLDLTSIESRRQILNNLSSNEYFIQLEKNIINTIAEGKINKIDIGFETKLTDIEMNYYVLFFNRLFQIISSSKKKLPHSTLRFFAKVGVVNDELRNEILKLRDTDVSKSLKLLDLLVKAGDNNSKKIIRIEVFDLIKSLEGEFPEYLITMELLNYLTIEDIKNLNLDILFFHDEYPRYSFKIDRFEKKISYNLDSEVNELKNLSEDVKISIYKELLNKIKDVDRIGGRFDWCDWEDIEYTIYDYKRFLNIGLSTLKKKMNKELITIFKEDDAKAIVILIEAGFYDFFEDQDFEILFTDLKFEACTKLKDILNWISSVFDRRYRDFEYYDDIPLISDEMFEFENFLPFLLQIYESKKEYILVFYNTLEEKKIYLALALVEFILGKIRYIEKYEIQERDREYHRCLTELLKYLIENSNLDFGLNFVSVNNCIFIAQKGKLSIKEQDIRIIDNIVGLKNLQNLKRLELVRCNIEEISGIEKLINLRELSLNFNQIKEIKNLDNLKKLKILSLSNNEISEIKGIENLIKLRDLDLTGNPLIHIKGLDKFKLLKQNYDFKKDKIEIVPKNEIKQIKRIAERELKEFWSKGSFRKKHLNYFREFCIDANEKAREKGHDEYQTNCRYCICPDIICSKKGKINLIDVIADAPAIMSSTRYGKIISLIDSKYYELMRQVLKELIEYGVVLDATYGVIEDLHYKRADKLEYFTKGSMLFEEGKIDEAIFNFEKALVLDKRSYNVIPKLLDSYLKKGEISKGLELCEKAIEIFYPNEEEFIHKLELFYAIQDREMG